MNYKLRAARERSKKTQAQVAQEAGVSEAIYQRYEYGTTRPTVNTALKIAKALGTTVEEIFDTDPI